MATQWQCNAIKPKLCVQSNEWNYTLIHRHRFERSSVIKGAEELERGSNRLSLYPDCWEINKNVQKITDFGFGILHEISRIRVLSITVKHKRTTMMNHEECVQQTYRRRRWVIVQLRFLCVCARQKACMHAHSHICCHHNHRHYYLVYPLA